MTEPGSIATHFHYLVFGLIVRSEMVLPALVPHASSDADVDIRMGEQGLVSDAPEGYQIVGDATVLTVSNVGRYSIEAGRSITVTPAPGASERNVRLYLLGSALGALLHQRKLIPLHANAVEVAGKAVAFMGHSGAGKSTLAAWFLDRGHSVMTDDVCVIASDEEQTVVHRGLVRLRLWGEALKESGRDIVEADRSFDDFDKFDVAIPGGQLAPARLPLGAVVLLTRADGGEAVALDRLHGMHAVEALVANIYRGGYAEKAGMTGSLVMACVALARKIPVMVARRHWGFGRLDEEGSRIEQALREVLGRDEPTGALSR